MDDLPDLTSFVRKTRGAGPPSPLIGATTTVVGDALYVFGGRSADSPATISAVLYRLDLGTFAWRRCPNGPSQLVPRCFHSANAFGDKLVVFGGQTPAQNCSIDAPHGSSPLRSGGDQGPTEHPTPSLPETTAAELRVLPETVERLPSTLASVAVYDTRTEQWSFPECGCGTGVTTIPMGRYGHLAAVTETTIDMAPGYTPEAKLSRLTIIGGQNANNEHVYSIAVLDLNSMQWIDEAKFPRRVGSYRAAATSSLVTIEPMSQNLMKTVDEHGTMQFSGSVHSSIARPSDEEQPEPIVVFSNTNFADPRREIDLVAAPVDQLSNPAFISVRNREGAASGPPGLRFPSAHICGHHMIVTGVHVDQAGTRLAIWSLDLGPTGASGALSSSGPLRWEQINSHIIKSGSWNLTVLYNNMLLLLGSKEANSADDYAHRRCNFQHVAIIDLEAFGMHEPPRQLLSHSEQSFGLLVLSQSSLNDFVVISRDGEHTTCSRLLLTTRWPWLKAELAKFEKRTSEFEMRSDTEGHSDDSEVLDPIQRARARYRKSQHIHPLRLDPSAFPLTEDSLRLPFDSSTTQALLQFFFTLSLSTPLQRSISTLNTLLWIVKTYPVFPPSLERLTVHALHESLSPNTAAKVFEAASLAGAAALRSRAARIMLKASAPSTTEYHSTWGSSSGHYGGSMTASSARPRSVDSLASKPWMSNETAFGHHGQPRSGKDSPTVDRKLIMTP
ncbi:BZ3500_MvSof-1268-A1-R1_Chr3-3g06478 [Microbotryum saponariae]|uniref:BZ3500_MvSof-1268-A1-R1_Chr3-3g06478 protein n=1 Tax=Microbotryum saponariae TaxID=289078 RepID=A0A2X0MUE8_9BASI|nr:BZ3500_MvSof-1268-A1-R1_Chr3-3g06478 [Microbotryum saponariae]SDA04445.1 BZ3501_MvSof-1269-A2-R1_Chr3-2g06165 [Microbotryum saponariae]